MNVLVRGPSSAVMSFVVLGWGCRKRPKKGSCDAVDVFVCECL